MGLYLLHLLAQMARFPLGASIEGAISEAEVEENGTAEVGVVEPMWMIEIISEPAADRATGDPENIEKNTVVIVTATVFTATMTNWIVRATTFAGSRLVVLNRATQVAAKLIHQRRWRMPHPRLRPSQTASKITK